VIDAISHEIVYEAKVAMGEVNSLAWAEAPGGRYLAGCGEHGVALWKVSHDRPLSVEEIFALDRNRCLATLLSRDAEAMVWVQDDTRLQAWDVASGRQKTLHAPPMWQGWHGMAFLPDGTSIIYVSKAGVAEVWNVREDRRVDSLGQPGTFNSNTVALSPDGRWFAGLTQPDTVSVWHLPTQRHVLSLRPETGSVWSLAWDPASEQLAVGQSDGGLAVWHLPRIQQKLAESSLEWQED
jgi:WD40 repeat protein